MKNRGPNPGIRDSSSRPNEISDYYRNLYRQQAHIKVGENSIFPADNEEDRKKITGKKEEVLNNHISKIEESLSGYKFKDLSGKNEALRILLKEATQWSVTENRRPFIEPRAVRCPKDFVEKSSAGLKCLINSFIALEGLRTEGFDKSRNHHDPLVLERRKWIHEKFYTASVFSLLKATQHVVSHSLRNETAEQNHDRDLISQAVNDQLVHHSNIEEEISNAFEKITQISEELFIPQAPYGFFGNTAFLKVAGNCLDSFYRNFATIPQKVKIAESLHFRCLLASSANKKTSIWTYWTGNAGGKEGKIFPQKTEETYDVIALNAAMEDPKATYKSAVPGWMAYEWNIPKTNEEGRVFLAECIEPDKYCPPLQKTANSLVAVIFIDPSHDNASPGKQTSQYQKMIDDSIKTLLGIKKN